MREVLATGYAAGYPLQDLRVIVYDGKSHPVDSKEVAFVAAGRKAFLDALEKAKPQVLEPIVSVEITAPESYMGDIAATSPAAAVKSPIPNRSPAASWRSLALCRWPSSTTTRRACTPSRRHGCLEHDAR